MPLVVLAEPDPATRELYQRALQQSCSVRTVESEQELLQVLTDEPVAAVVLEPNLFGDEAWPAVARTAAVCRSSGALLLICSTQDERRRGFALGVADYLLKPTLPAALTEQLQRHLAQPVAGDRG